MVLLKLNNKIFKHMDITYTYDMYILYINVMQVLTTCFIKMHLNV